MSRSAEEILALYTARKARLDPMHRAALAVRNAYYGDTYLPLPEIDANEKPLVANILYSAGEQKSMRVASTMPDLYYPPTTPNQTLAEKRARQRRMVNLAWWDRDKAKIKMRKRARHLVYYAHSPVMLRPDMKERRPTWQIRNPLSALAPEMDIGDVSPEDVIFTYPKPYAWLCKHYPAKMGAFGDAQGTQDGTFTILEYQDEFDMVLLVVGTKVERTGPGYAPEIRKTEIAIELERVPNRVGQCTAVFAGGIGLDHPRGSYDGTIGLWQAMGKIMALQAIGLQRSIWPETWIENDPNGTGGRVVTMADPLSGTIGQIDGGKLNVIQPHINQDGLNIMDRLERAIRIDSSTPAELGGESTSNIRTGRRGDQILSSVLDFPLQEMQEILAESLEAENKVAIAIDKAYFPTSKSIVVSGSAGEFTYVATDLWETDTHYVKYAHAGVDAQGLVIEGAQRIGVGSLSIRSFMEMDPLVEDPQMEFDRITQEQLRKALLNGLEQMSQDPSLAPVIAEIAVRNRGKELEIEDAVIQVHAALQQMQAEQAAQQQAPMGAPGMPGPEAQPGMAAPQASIGPPPEGLGNLTALLGQLKRGAGAAVPNQLGIAS